LAGKKPTLQGSHFYFDHVNRLLITLIGAAFYRGFFAANHFSFFHFKSFSITFDWLEKSLYRKRASIEVIISLFT